ncbi:hypothetical protein [Bartonella sp. WD16.2]|uniref:hypothetical protein n=1 Tax=Bartonella sp. WD16.2 TaxID=1933904 RepID=UPI0012947B6A|nr:hypothetical protein [Bartonella sp. WD16.2]
MSNFEFKALQNFTAALEQDLLAEQMEESLQTVINIYHKANTLAQRLLFDDSKSEPEIIQEVYEIEDYKNENKAQ